MVVSELKLVALALLTTFTSASSTTVANYLLSDVEQRPNGQQMAAFVGSPASWPQFAGELDSWNYWWSYSGVSGPTYWGLLNLDWLVCDKGKQQSPINIETRSLVYDPHLDPLKIDNNLISGVLYNDGHAIVFNGSLAGNFGLNIAGQSHTDQSIKGNGSRLLVLRHNNQDALRPKTNSDLGELANSIQFGPNQEEDEEEEEEKRRVADHQLMASVQSLASEGQQGDQLSNSLDANDAELGIGAQHDETTNRIKIHGGSSNYVYLFDSLYLRFGADSELGSEHRINGRAYVAELQMLAYNWHLYRSYAEAAIKPHGLLAISVLIEEQQQQQLTDGAQGGRAKMGPAPNAQLETLLSKLPQIGHRGASTVITGFNLSALLPETNHFVTYQGSLTTPGCHESVNWLVLNKPLYINKTQLAALRSISADEQSSASTGTLIAGNVRPLQPVNNRPIRTNIKPSSGENCKKLWTGYEYQMAT